MIYIFKIGHLPYTPFDENFSKEDLTYLNTHGIQITNSKKKASIFVAGNNKSIKKFFLKNPWKKNYLIWANEPRFSTVNSKVYYPFKFFPKVHVMNIYTGEVFINNVAYQNIRFINNEKLEYLNQGFIFSSKKIATLISYYNGGKSSKLFVNSSNIDLIKKRSDISLFCFQNKMMDIFGNGWPNGISKEDSRMVNRHARKKEILNNYHFNLCFENTVYPKYITEKIWESIENYCLPIYYGGLNSSIYEIFPENSFLDYSKFENPKKLLIYIENLKVEEFVLRMNKCIAVYNGFIEKSFTFWEKNKKLMLDNIINKCRFIIQKPS